MKLLPRFYKSQKRETNQAAKPVLFLTASAFTLRTLAGREKPRSVSCTRKITEDEMKISIETEVKAPLSNVWDAWVTPEDITSWNFAIDEWCCPKAEINLQEGDKFSYRMEAKDGSMGFDFEGRFTEIKPHKSICYELEDSRVVTVEFSETTSGVRVIQTFEAEDENSAEQQRQGWQSILNNFKKHVEAKSN
jgi:uncharacterized protein YndB with AHSA1/START domain